MRFNKAVVELPVLSQRDESLTSLKKAQIISKASILFMQVGQRNFTASGWSKYVH